jgi:hypothetical protein
MQWWSALVLVLVSTWLSSQKHPHRATQSLVDLETDIAVVALVADRLGLAKASVAMRLSNLVVAMMARRAKCPARNSDVSNTLSPV